MSSCSSTKKKEITYDVDGITHKGYFSKSKLEGKRPAVIVVHEWWGLNSYARKRADMLSELGYHALALDMYGNGKIANHPKEAGAFSQEAMKDPNEVKKRFLRAVEYLKKNENVDGDKIAAIGYCFGGGVVLNMARMGVDLKGVASFHGNLTPLKKAKKGQVKARLLVLNGAADPFIKKSDIKEFKKEMKLAGVKYEFINYPGAKHSFTNPEADQKGSKFQLPIQYNKEADQKSWQKMSEFLKDIF